MHAQNCTPGAAVTPRAAHRSGQPEHITTPRPAACPPMADAGRGDGEPPTASPDPAPAQAPIDALAAEPALNDALSPPREFLLDTTTEQPRTEAVALTPVVAEQDETCVYVFGANVGAAPDAATAKLAKRVLQISVVLILLQAIIAVVYYVRDEPLALILITLCFSLAHPTCGIFGVMNKDRSLLCMFCGYGCIQCAADAITCVLCIVYAVSKSGKKRRDFAMLAAYYFVQGVIHYVVFYWGNKLYIHKGFDARAVHPEARAERRRRREAVPVAATSRLEDDGFAAAAYADVEAGAAPWVLSPKSGADDDDDRPAPAAAAVSGDDATPAAAAVVPAVTPREEPAG